MAKHAVLEVPDAQRRDCHLSAPKFQRIPAESGEHVGNLRFKSFYTGPGNQRTISGGSGHGVCSLDEPFFIDHDFVPRCRLRGRQWHCPQGRAGDHRLATVPQGATRRPSRTGPGGGGGGQD